MGEFAHLTVNLPQSRLSEVTNNLLKHTVLRSHCHPKETVTSVNCIFKGYATPRFMETRRVSNPRSVLGVINLQSGLSSNVVCLQAQNS